MSGTNKSIIPIISKEILYLPAPGGSHEFLMDDLGTLLLLEYSMSRNAFDLKVEKGVFIYVDYLDLECNKLAFHMEWTSFFLTLREV